MSKKRANVAAHIIKAEAPIAKAENPTQLDENSASGLSEWLSPPADLRGFKLYAEHSSILPQCIRAYKNNIAGFGIGVRYKEDYPDETPEMKAEFTKAEEVLELLNMDMDTKEVFEDVIEARETFGIGYLEVVRNIAGAVTGIEFIKDTPSMRKTIPLNPYVEVGFFFKDRIEKRMKKFCKYRQQIGPRTVYFKEIGDTRIMDNRTGMYVAELEIEHQANEILEFAIGTSPYGEVRWIGQVLNVDGSRKAEGLNNRYFEEGRHTPLLIAIEGGTLTDESFEKLQTYMNDIKGEKGQHAFMVLETEAVGNKIDFAEEDKPKITIHNLASMLQKDELFQDYLENSRRKVQSSFQLPDLYVGYTTDFNRATAQTAQEVTEKQVFQPERKSLAWAINNKLLNGYGLKFVEAYFLEPDITNPDDLAKVLNITERAGGLTPNKAKEITYAIMGEISENYDGEWADTPLQYLKSAATPPGVPAPTEVITEQLNEQIKKASSIVGNDAVVAVMKEVKALLLKMEVHHDA